MVNCSNCHQEVRWNGTFFNAVRELFGRPWSTLLPAEKTQATQTLKERAISLFLNLDGTPHACGTTRPQAEPAPPTEAPLEEMEFIEGLTAETFNVTPEQEPEEVYSKEITDLIDSYAAQLLDPEEHWCNLCKKWFKSEEDIQEHFQEKHEYEISGWNVFSWQMVRGVLMRKCIWPVCLILLLDSPMLL